MCHSQSRIDGIVCPRSIRIQVRSSLLRKLTPLTQEQSMLSSLLYPIPSLLQSIFQLLFSLPLPNPSYFPSPGRLPSSQLPPLFGPGNPLPSRAIRLRLSNRSTMASKARLGYGSVPKLCQTLDDSALGTHASGLNVESIVRSSARSRASEEDGEGGGR